MAKAKVYGFSPWVDQVDAINQLMKETGEKTESVLLRNLVDEALEARRNKTQTLPLIDETNHEFGDRLSMIEKLLMLVVRQGETSLRIEDVSLALLQSVLAEAHSTNSLTWQFAVVPHLRGQGVGTNELEHRFTLQMDQAKDYAYGEAERIKKSQDPQGQ